jgi:hypothetical protein
VEGEIGDEDLVNDLELALVVYLLHVATHRASFSADMLVPSLWVLPSRADGSGRIDAIGPVRR